MEISGKIERTWPMVSGGNPEKPWFKQDFLLDIAGVQYPRKLLFSLWGTKIDEYMLKENDEITAQISIESKSSNDRYFTNVTAYNITKHNAQVQTSGKKAEAKVPSQKNVPVMNLPPEDNNDDLPF